MAEKTLKERLQTRHPDWILNSPIWTLLDDCRTGKGGFSTPLDSPLWSAKGPSWSNEITNSYIVPFKREDKQHYAARVRSSVYVNHFRRIQDTILGFLARSPIKIENLPPELEEWRSNADGLGNSLDVLLNSVIASDMLTFGFSIVKVDRPRSEVKNQLIALDSERPYVTLVDPRIQTGWEVLEESGKLSWQKFEEEFVYWSDPLADPVVVTRWTIFTPESITVFECPSNEKEPHIVNELSLDTNPIGEIPIVIGFADGPQTTFKIPVSQLQSAAFLSHWLFNRGSEEVDLFRGRGFPLLVWPVAGNKLPKGLKAGNDVAVPFPMEATQSPQYLQPDGSTAANYDTLIKRGESQLYEQTRTDFSRTGAQVESGVSRTIRFQSMNASLVAFASSLATVAKDICSMVLKWNAPAGQSVDTVALLQDAIFEAPSDYDVEDLDRELAQYQTGLEMNLGPIAEAEIKKRARDKLVTIRDDKLTDSNKEIDLEAATQVTEQTAGNEIPPLEQIEV